MSYFEQEILNQLNEPQREVVKTTEGPLLVLAGAGSGKTRSVIYRVAWLIKVKKVKPWNILVVTFTNKAARELKDRIDHILEGRIQVNWVGTFHSICLRILRAEISLLPNYSSEFTVFDRDDQTAVIKKVYAQLNLSKDNYPINKIISIISKQKSQLIEPDNFFDFNDKSLTNIVFHQIFQLYTKFLENNNAMDFDDLLLKTVKLLFSHKEVQNKYEELFKYIMVDEYQDTNLAQFRIIQLLSEHNHNLCVVGDDDQSIYGWRGADIRNILSFNEDFKKAVIIKLEQNYRSTKPIVDLANSIICENSSRHDKILWTSKESSDLPKLIAHDNETAEAKYIVEDILDYSVKKKSPFSESVILYRTNAQSRVFEQQLSRNHIPYIIYGGLNFYQRSEIKDMISWLRVISNPKDNISLLRILNVPPRGIGKTTINQLIDISLDHNSSLFEIIEQIDKVSTVNKKAKLSIKDFSENINKWHRQSVSTEIHAILCDIIQSYDLNKFYTNQEEIRENSKTDNILELVAAAKEFEERFLSETNTKPGISDFLQQISLQTDFDTNEKKEDRDAVRLMTMHNAKGLEFDNVYISGLEQGLIPHNLSIPFPEQVEEERRLLYVGVTRARRYLQLHYAHTRRVADRVINCIPSLFLKDIKNGLLEENNVSYWELRAPERTEFLPKKEVLKSSVITENEKYFKIGQKILHQNHGFGVILSVEGVSKDAKLTISFNNGMIKKIIGNWVEIVYE